MSTPPLSSAPSTAAASPSMREPIRGFPGWLFLLGALNVIGPLSIDMYLPGLPQIAVDLHTDTGAVQRTLAAFFIGLSLGQLFYGPFSDRFGRKPPIYFGLGIYTLASLGCAYATDVHTLTIWRFAQALGGCAGMMIPRAVVRDRCDPIGMVRAMSMLMLVMGLGPMLAPLLGTAVMALFGWRAIFLILAAFSAVCLVMVAFGLRETLDPRNVQPLHLSHVLGNYGALLRDRSFMQPAITSSLTQAGMFAYIAGSPFVMIDLYGLSPQSFSWVFGVNAVGMVMAAQINARLVRRVPMPTVLRYALMVSATTGVSMLAGQLAGGLPLPLMLVGLFVLSSTLGFIGPTAGALSLQHQGHRAGMASALSGCLMFGMGTAAGVLMSTWHRPDASPLLVTMMVCACSALLVGGRIKRATA